MSEVEIEFSWREVFDSAREFREKVKRRETVKQQKRDERERRVEMIRQAHRDEFNRPLIGEEYRPCPKWRKQYADRVRGAQRWYSPE